MHVLPFLVVVTPGVGGGVLVGLGVRLAFERG